MHFFLLFENLWHEVSCVVIAEYIFLSILDPFSFKVGSPCMKCIIRVCTHWLKTTHIFPSINLHKCIVEFAENANRKFFLYYNSFWKTWFLHILSVTTALVLSLTIWNLTVRSFVFCFIIKLLYDRNHFLCTCWWSRHKFRLLAD